MLINTLDQILEDLMKGLSRNLEKLEKLGRKVSNVIKFLNAVGKIGRIPAFHFDSVIIKVTVLIDVLV